MSLLAFTTPGPSEWMFILVIVLVLFGAKKLPELARSLGQSMNEFKKAREDFDRELQHAASDIRTQQQQPPPAVQGNPPQAAPVQYQPAAQVVAAPPQTPAAAVNPPPQAQSPGPIPVVVPEGAQTSPNGVPPAQTPHQPA